MAAGHFGTYRKRVHDEQDDDDAGDNDDSDGNEDEVIPPHLPNEDSSRDRTRARFKTGPTTGQVERRR